MGGRTGAMRAIRFNGTLLGASATFVGAGLALLLFFTVQPPYRSVVESTSFDEHGTFDYSAALGRNVYDDNELRVPQPLFRRLGDQLPFEYRYAVSSALPLEDAHGRYSLTAEVRQSNGWARALPLVTDAEFVGSQFAARGVIDVATVADLIRQLEVETGYKSPTFRVRVLAHVAFEARVAGQPLVRAHDQVLDFALSDIEMRLDREASVVVHNAPGEVRYPVDRPRTITVPLTGFELAHSQLPALSLGLLLVGGGLAAAALFEGWRSARQEEDVPRHYRKRVVAVSEPPVPPGGGGRTAEVADLDALLRLAEDYHLPVLRTTGPPMTYWVLADTSYVHVAGREPGARAPMRAPPRPAATLSEEVTAESAPAAPPIPPSSSPGAEGLPAWAATRSRHAWTSFGQPAEALPEVGSLGVGSTRGVGVDAHADTDTVASPEDAPRFDPPPRVEAPRRSRRYWGELASDAPDWDEREAA
ncbi:MAG: hypothetical protein IT299_09875 [Dehalococcoidia bacterium]|nr:hypothetical protein [Dehalococcoidia bacterium]